ncbi:cyclase family protein [Iamia sp.]|uniref:cyclase family protein n=1 Tax=Iamia sp. TaxID=2722710 RepID=UPI002C5DB096|nr:cyclase family protein [Iamia sp.]HXH55866.1 cyclase family protein [Iamia sp.]
MIPPGAAGRDVASPTLPSHVEEVRARVSNWGRWGDDDQRGCANLLDAAAARRGSVSVRTGERFSLALDLGPDGPQVGQPAHRTNPTLEMLIVNQRDRHAPGVWVSSDDAVHMSTCAGTHIDTLAHVAYDGLLWNGFPASSISTETGATVCGAETLSPIVTRGIVVDLPRLRGVAGLDEIDPGYAVGGADLDEALDAAGLTPEPGDVLLVRTGDIRHLHAGDRTRYALGDGYRFPGPSLGSVEWIHGHDIAGVFTDTYAYEAFPPPSPDWSDTLCVHMLHIRDMGLLQGQSWDLEALSAACAEAGRSDVLLVAAPEPIVGATSAPVAPVAVL